MERARKPDTASAMRAIIGEARRALPFHLPAAELCAGPCQGCPKKLLEFIDGELFDWTERLDRGEIPTLGDVSALGKRCRKIYAAIAKNGLIQPD